MSGVKRITVDAGDWGRARQAAARLRDVNRELPGMLEAVRQDNQAAIDRATAQVQARQDAVDRAMAGLSEQARRLEAAARQRLADRAAQLRGELRDTASQLRAQTRAGLEASERRLTELLERERREREREASLLRDEVAGIQADRGQALALARAHVSDAGVMRDAIARELPHDQFAPGRLAELDSRLDIARGNLGRGLGEVALGQAQEAYLQLSELRAEVELRHQEWQAARVDARHAVTLLRQQIAVNASPDAIDENGDPVAGCTLDVDFWSEGELSGLRDSAAALMGRLADEGSPPAVAELRQIARAASGELDQRLTTIVATAQARQVASQVRANLAELVVGTLEETAGYTWEEGQAIYAGDDQRRAFYAKLRHVDDSEIVVEVSPDAAGESCTLRILSYDGGLADEEERVRRAHAVHASLRERGLEAGLPAADEERPDPRLADFAALRAPAAGRVRAAPGAKVAEPGQG